MLKHNNQSWSIKQTEINISYEAGSLLSKRVGVQLALASNTCSLDWITENRRLIRNNAYGAFCSEYDMPTASSNAPLSNECAFRHKQLW